MAKMRARQNVGKRVHNPCRVAPVGDLRRTAHQAGNPRVGMHRDPLFRRGAFLPRKHRRGFIFLATDASLTLSSVTACRCRPRWLVVLQPCDDLARRGEREMDEETKPKRAAKDNPWYRLATSHGEPADYNGEIATKNGDLEIGPERRASAAVIAFTRGIRAD